MCSGLDGLRRYHEDLAWERDGLEYEIDGAVFKVNDLSQQEKLGVRARDPQWAMAYKFQPRQATTRIRKIRVQVGRTGMLTPVADLEPGEIAEVGPEVANSIATFFADGENRREIERLREAGLELSNPDHAREATTRPLDGLSIVFTGRLERWKRSEAEGLVGALGGRSSSSVSGETDYVVAGSGAGSKVEEAKERGVPVMDEEDFAGFLEERGAGRIDKSCDR